VFQVTAEPPQFAASCNKENYTAEFITKSGAFAVSVLHNDTDPDIIGRFGYKCGRDFDKFDGIDVKYGETGVPIIMNDCIAFLECKVVQTVDVGTHLIFIGELVQAELVDDTKEPITYLHYRRVRKGLSPKNAPTYIDKSKTEAKPIGSGLKKFECTACGYVYDEDEQEVRLDDLPQH